MNKDTKILKIEKILNEKISGKVMGTYCLIEFVIDEWEKLN